MQRQTNRLKVLTWHIHGSYLYYLSFANVDFYLPYKDDKSPGYGGRTSSFPWSDNIIEIPANEVKNYDFDCILFQSPANYYQDQYDILSKKQQGLPALYLEHDPPREVPTETRHHVRDGKTTIVHVTHFNQLMWDNGSNPTAVIDHGVTIPPTVSYNGIKEKGIVVVNNIALRGRRLGYDIFEKVRREVPLDIIGMGSEDVNGLGEIPHNRLPRFLSCYRFFFNPIRYTSLGLSLCEAMMAGLPIVGLATTEMPTVIQNNVHGYLDTNIDNLIQFMKYLLKSPKQAKELGENAKKLAHSRFGIERFAQEWEQLFKKVVNEQKNAPTDEQVTYFFNAV